MSDRAIVLDGNIEVKTPTMRVVLRESPGSIRSVRLELPADTALRHELHSRDVVGLYDHTRGTIPDGIYERAYGEHWDGTDIVYMLKAKPLAPVPVWTPPGSGMWASTGALPTTPVLNTVGPQHVTTGNLMQPAITPPAIMPGAKSALDREIALNRLSVLLANEVMMPGDVVKIGERAVSLWQGGDCSAMPVCARRAKWSCRNETRNWERWWCDVHKNVFESLLSQAFNGKSVQRV